MKSIREDIGELVRHLPAELPDVGHGLGGYPVSREGPLSGKGFVEDQGEAPQIKLWARRHGRRLRTSVPACAPPRSECLVVTRTCVRRERLRQTKIQQFRRSRAIEPDVAGLDVAVE